MQFRGRCFQKTKGFLLFCLGQYKVNRVFWKISYIVVVICALCAGVAFCASVTRVNSYLSCRGNDVVRSCGPKKTGEPCSLFADSTDTHETLLNPFDIASKEFFVSRISLPTSQFNVQELVWVTPNRSFGYDQQGGTSRNSNTSMTVVTASTEDAFDIDSPAGIIMIVTSFLAFAGYILERIITARRSPYGRR